eukprot:Nk52_evm28s296 gene=Nk52_evmTU28s296
MKSWAGSLVLLAAVLAALCVSSSFAISALSIDFGAGWIKVGLVKPGVPMEMVLNPETQRKTAAVMSMKNDERFFGSFAQGVATKFPKFAYSNIQQIVGSGYGSPVMRLYEKNHPYNKIINGSDYGVPMFEHPDGHLFSSEEITAMFFEYAKDIAEAMAEGPVANAVITVPAYFNQAERKAVEHAAELIGLNVKQVINDNTAIALHYAVFRMSDITKDAKNILFYDFGYGSTVATLAQFSIQDVKKNGRLVKTPVVKILSSAYDRTLGAVEFEYRLRDYMAEKAQGLKGIKSDLKSTPRAMMKLHKEAIKVMKVLSANTNTFAQIENVADDVDFKLEITREQFETMCADLLDRVQRPVTDVLKYVDMNIEEVAQMILVGGTTRVPRVQQLLLEVNAGRELGKSINADEAPALGAVFQAAALSRAFRVKDIVVKDASMFPISVSYDKQQTEFEDSVRINKVIFSHLNEFPQSKGLSFKNNLKDFSFDVNYGDLSYLPESSLDLIEARNISTVSIEGLTEAVETHGKDNFKGVKVHFNMNPNGIVEVTGIDATFKNKEELEEEKKGVFEKLSGFFSSNKEEADVQEEKSAEEKENTDNEDMKKDDEDSKSTEETEKEKDREKEGETPSEDEKKNEEETKNDGETKSDEEANEKDKDGEKGGKEEMGDEKKKEEDLKPKQKKKAPKPIVVKLRFTEVYHDRVPYSPERVEKEKGRLTKLKEEEMAKKEKEATRNKLESYIYETRDKITSEDYITVSNDEQREALNNLLSASSEWLDDDGWTADTPALKEKISDIEVLFKPINSRRNQMLKRPKFIERFNQTLNISSMMLGLMQNQTDRYTQQEIDSLEVMIKEATEWLDRKSEAQDKLLPHEDPVLTLKDLKAEYSKLEREVEYLAKKPLPTPPKPVEVPKNETDAKNETATNTESGSENVEKEEVKDDTVEKQDEETAEEEEATEDSEDGEARGEAGEEEAEGAQEQMDDDIDDIITETQNTEKAKEERESDEL